MAESVRGAQIGVVNASGDVNGAQIGVLNVARSSKFSLGVVNVARESDVALGVINIIENGYRAVEAWTSETAIASVGVKLGGRHTYSILAAGGSEERFQFGGGLGIHLPFSQMYVDIDVMALSLFDTEFGTLDVDLLGKIRAAIGYRLSPKLAVFGGPSATGVFNFDVIGNKPVRPPGLVGPETSVFFPLPPQATRTRARGAIESS